MPPSKTDLYRLHQDEYKAARKPALVACGQASYLAIEGKGAPGSKAFTASIGALYGVAFTVKMTRKFDGLEDYVVCKLEAQWWCDRGKALSAAPTRDWRWKLLIRTPEFVKQKEVDQAVSVLLKRGKGTDVERVKLETLSEGECVQMLHVGPYEDEHKTVDLMAAFATSKARSFHGRHHEIYLSDPRRVEASKLKTILRMPVRASS